MFFVARTDVGADSGMQRSFGVFDTQEEAQRLADDLKSRLVGSFEVFQGQPVNSETQL
jgi:hypothetical protein